MINLIFSTIPYIVCIITSANYFVGYCKSFRECVFKHIAFLFTVCLWIDIHVTTVTTTTESTDFTIFKSVTICCSFPCKVTLNIHFHRLEVEVKEVRIDKRTFFILRRKIKRADTFV